jgi:GDPmannose 4,6-dehydratase
MGINGTETVLITGVTGMDASVMTNYLLGLGYKVIGVKRRSSTENLWRLQGFINHANFTLVEGDITDLYSMIELLKTYKPKYVLNFAAMSHVGTSFEQPQLTFDVTANGAINVMNACKLVDKSIRIFQASTSEMYGDQYSVVNGEKIQDHNTLFKARSPYAVAKQAAHDYAVVMRESYGMYVCPTILFNHTHTTRGENFVERKITRYIGRLRKFFVDHIHYKDELPGSNIGNYCYVTGPNDLEDCGEYLRSGSVKFPKLKLGNVNSYRDFGWSPDYMEAVWMIMNQETPEDYVIATSKTYQIKDVLDLAFRKIGISDWTYFVDIDKSLFRPNEVEYLRGSYEKLNKNLGWAPKYGIEQIIDEMVKFDIELAKKENV